MIVMFICQRGFAKECMGVFAQKTKKIVVSKSILNNRNLQFIPRENALAMNIEYTPVFKLREEIKNAAGMSKPLAFLTAWEPNGEAHITVITPPEAAKIFAENEKHISKARIDEIAKEYKIQHSDLKILGIGSGKKLIDDCLEQTFYIVIKSQNLLDIRRQIYNEFVKNGGNKNDFNPDHFYPHITIGYTLRDLHESDDVIKDVNSLDSRFKLILK